MPLFYSICYLINHLLTQVFFLSLSLPLFNIDPVQFLTAYHHFMRSTTTSTTINQNAKRDTIARTTNMFALLLSVIVIVYLTNLKNIEHKTLKMRKCKCKYIDCRLNCIYDSESITTCHHLSMSSLKCSNWWSDEW